MVDSGKTSNRNLKLEMEILKIDQEIQKKKKNSDEIQKSLSTAWSAFIGGSFFCLVMGTMAVKEDSRWWGGFAIMLFFALLGLWTIIKKNSKAKEINREVEKLEKKKKELSNSIR